MMKHTIEICALALLLGMSGAAIAQQSGTSSGSSQRNAGPGINGTPSSPGAPGVPGAVPGVNIGTNSGFGSSGTGTSRGTGTGSSGAGTSGSSGTGTGSGGR